MRERTNEITMKFNRSESDPSARERQN